MPGHLVPTDLAAVAPAQVDESLQAMEAISDEDVPKSRSVEWAVGAIAFVLLMVGWYLLSTAVSPIVFPSPFKVLDALVGIARNGQLVSNLMVTVWEIILGFIGGSILGIGLGAILARSPSAQRIINPYLIATQAMPKLALAPMLVLWFGFGVTSKIVIAALIAFFPLLENTVVGLREVPREELRLFQSFSATERQTFFKLRIPNALPYIFAGLRVAMLFATVGAVVGEYVGANVGLGALIIVSYGTLNTSLMFAVMIVLTMVGIVLYKLVEWAEKWIRRRIPE